MINKLKTLLNDYFWLCVIAFLLFVGWITFQTYSDWQDGAANRTVSKQSIQANVAVKQAANANNAAANVDIQRRTEDLIREQTINPKLSEARRRSNASRNNLEKTRATHENEKLHPENLSAADADNCRKLRDLFPNTDFADCR